MTFSVRFRLIQRRDNVELEKRFGDGIPDVAEIAKNISLVLVNQHYSFTGPKPLSNQLIEVGGMHLKTSKPIPQVKVLYILCIWEFVISYHIVARK